MRRLLPAVLLVTCTSVAFIACLPTTTQAASAAAADQCEPVAVTALSYMNLDGTGAQASGPDIASVYHYALAPGDDIRQIVPPTDFDPLTASDEALLVLGLPARPSGGDALTQWTTRFLHWKGVVRQPICVRPRGETIDTSDNWSGFHDYGYGDYRRLDAQVRVPAGTRLLTAPAAA